jgi:DNA-directed RNA polymerase I subunit RPA12
MATTWPFCPHCHALLWITDARDAGTVQCDICSFQTTLEEVEQSLGGVMPTTRHTLTHTRPVPDWAKPRSQQQQQPSQRTLATIAEPCIQCGHAEVGYYTAQLRSVDEGQTVFYECPQCRHHWSTNN